MRVGREVFHVPTRSHFVFVSQIKAYKGSDASNVYDEEPGDDELEFSDDEAEIAYRSSLKRKCVAVYASARILTDNILEEGNHEPAQLTPRDRVPLTRRTCVTKS